MTDTGIHRDLGLRNTRPQVRRVRGKHHAILFSLRHQHGNREGLHDGIAIEGPRHQTQTDGGRDDHAKRHQAFKLVLCGRSFKERAQERAQRADIVFQVIGTQPRDMIGETAAQGVGGLLHAPQYRGTNIIDAADVVLTILGEVIVDD
jgi:hypothetical protein